MNKKYLTLAQNTCAARIFLNTFDLILENVENIDEFSKIKIFDKTMNTVGCLYFDNGKIVMTAKYNDNILNANFDIAKILSFVDRECNDALFGEWDTKVSFEFQSNNYIKLSGEFSLNCSVDSEFGIACICHPLINCEVPEQGNVSLKMLRDGRVFEMNAETEDLHEEIYLMPGDTLNGFIRHKIERREKNSENSSPFYRMYAGIFNGGDLGENKDKLHVFLTEDEYENNLSYHNEMIPKVESENSSEVLIQKGLLMQELDPEMFKKISQLRKLLLIDNVSLLDNLISICYDSYSDEEISALLGIKRRKLIYQDGSDNLINSYFELGKNGQILSLEDQKKLLKK